MQKAAVEPDVGHDEERDGRHQDEMDAPDEGGGAWPAVTQDGAHEQLDQKQDQSNCGQPEAIGEARHDVARTQGWPGMPQREAGEEQGEPVMRPEWQERRRHRGVARRAPASDEHAIQIGNGNNRGKQRGTDPAPLAGRGEHGE